VNRPMDDDERLRALLHDAVSDVEPHDHLGEVRRRTRARRTPSRRWAPVLIGGGAVAATVVAATFAVNGLGDDPEGSVDPPVAATSETGPTTAAAGLYFVSETATGLRLFREFQAVGIPADPEQEVLLALQRLSRDAGPRDPDYVTLWPDDSFAAVRLEEDRIVVELGTAEALTGNPADGRIGVQQAVYTAEGALGVSLPVSFEWDGEPTRRVLGFEAGTVVPRDRGYDVTAPVNISNPAEGLAVEDDVLRADGAVATNIETEVLWSLAPVGAEAVLEGSAGTADTTSEDATATLGAPGWETQIDLSGLAPGAYVFTVRVTAEGQTSDQPTEFTDTRTITVR
jgi:hypothetical protein